MTSRLVIGTPRIPAKPPRRVPCTEPDPPTGDYLLDPGFENWVDNFGTDQIPERGINSAGFPWVQAFMPGVDLWEVETTDPDAGTYHAEALIPISGSGSQAARWLEPIRFMHCEPLGAIQANAGRIRGGAEITWTCRAKVSSVADGQPVLSMPVDFFTEDGSGTGGGTSLSSLTDLTTSYATYTCTGTAPASARWMRAFIWPRHDVASSTVKTVRVDSFTLTAV